MAASKAELRQRLEGGLRPGRFAPLRSDFAAREPAAVFHVLFPIAVEFTGDGADQVAARLLVDLEPACPVSCRDALISLAFADWWVSDKLVPYYLVTQFGKRKLLRVADELVAEAGLTGSQITAITGVVYWARLPTVRLLAPFLPWEPR